MRYGKGTIHLNEAKDIPLLQQVFHGVYSTRDQLYEFMQQRQREPGLNAFRMRLAKLVKNELAQRVSAPGNSQFLYAITRPGVDVLVDRGIPYAGRGCGLDRPVTTASHALQINEMHLALLRSGQLREWLPEAEIYSRNTLTDFGFAKDYDAVATFAGEEQSRITFALEYERSQKTDAEYHATAIALNRESRADLVLYAAANSHLFAKLAVSFRQCRQTVAICLATEFTVRLFDTNVLLANEQWRMTLRELVSLKSTVKAKPAMQSA